MLNKLLLTLTLLVTALAYAPTAYAQRSELRCRRFLFFDFACRTVTIDYQMQKQVRQSGVDEFTTEIDPLLNSQEVIFRVELTNNGDVTDDNLKLQDTLPVNLDFVSSEDFTAQERILSTNVGDELGVGETITLSYVAQANIEGVAPGEKRCVTNNAVLYRDENGDNAPQEEEQEASASNTVCILNGQVTGDSDVGDENGFNNITNADELPDSAVGGLTTILASLATLVTGTLLIRKVHF